MFIINDYIFIGSKLLIFNLAFGNEDLLLLVLNKMKINDKVNKSQLYAVITENDESIWNDETGVVYHFPKRYLDIVNTGTKVIYYKGRIKNIKYRSKRMTDEAHYFGIATIGRIYNDRQSSKGDKFAVIEDFRKFTNPVLIKESGNYLEYIPNNRVNNYWRDGVRTIDVNVYNNIVALSGGLKEANEYLHEVNLPSASEENWSLESFVEGDSSKKYVTIYERNYKLRRQAILIHGYSCKACGFNFEKYYGEYGREFIHVHHVKPISEYDGLQKVNPETDLTVLCPNCHSMIHRYKNKTLSLDELIEMLNLNKSLEK